MVSFSKPAPGTAPLGAHQLLVFARGAAPDPVEHAAFEGAAAPGARVRVGSTLVTADPRGRYRATVDARGVVTVEGFLAGKMSPVDEHAVPLDGRRGAYTADIRYVNDGP